MPDVPYIVGQILYLLILGNVLRYLGILLFNVKWG